MEYKVFFSCRQIFGLFNAILKKRDADLIDLIGRAALRLVTAH